MFHKFIQAFGFFVFRDFLYPHGFEGSEVDVSLGAQEAQDPWKCCMLCGMLECENVAPEQISDDCIAFGIFCLDKEPEKCMEIVRVLDLNFVNGVCSYVP